MKETLHMVLSDTTTLFMVLGSGLIVSCSALNVLAKIVTGLSRERTRREVAAYIAEGSMTPEQGERILAARHRE